MPTYDYACTDCGGFDALRPLSARDQPVACPACGAASPRVFAAAPRLQLLQTGTRGAMELNERARHEPKRSGDYQRMRHPAGCGCCAPSSRRTTTVTATNGAKAFPSKRPWMISH